MSLLEDAWDFCEKYKMSDEDSNLLRATLHIGICAVDLISKLGLKNELKKVVEEHQKFLFEEDNEE